MAGLQQLDMRKHGVDIQIAVRDVSNRNKETNWLMLGYDAGTASICVVEKGSGGLDELLEEFSPSRVLYGWARVEDDNTGLAKYVLIQWQGQGAPAETRAYCAAHCPEISDLLQTVHLTVAARTEDDLNSDSIREQLRKSTARISTRSDAGDEEPSPVKSVYKRVNPIADIKPKVREKFWARQEREEAERLKADAEQRSRDKEGVEAQRIAREKAEAAARDAKENDKLAKAREWRQAEAAANWASAKQSSQDTNPEESISRPVQGCDITKERTAEAQQLISGSTKSRLAAWRQIERTGSVDERVEGTPPPQTAPPARKLAEFVPVAPATDSSGYQSPSETASASSHQAAGSVDSTSSSPVQTEAPPLSPVHVSPQPYNASRTASAFSPVQAPSAAPTPPQVIAAPVATPPPPPVAPATVSHRQSNGHVKAEPIVEICESLRHVAVSSKPINFVKAEYDYQAEDDTELTFDPADVIAVTQHIDDGWWLGYRVQPAEYRLGMFPSNYVVDTQHP